MASTTKVTEIEEGHVAYITHLKDELQEANLQLKKQCSETELEQEKFNSQKNRTKYLETYFDKISDTNELAKEVISSIENNKAHTSRVAKIGNLIVISAKILIVNAEKLACDIGSLDERIDMIIDQIKKVSPPPAPNSPILKAVYKLETAVTDAQTSILDCLTKILKFYKVTEVLSGYLGDDQHKTGLAKDIMDLLSVIKFSHSDKNEETKLIKFPRETCPHDYYERTEDEFNKSEKELQGLIETLNDLLQKKGKKQSRKDALQKSVDAVEAASKC